MTEEFRHADALRSADVPHRLSPEAREAIRRRLRDEWERSPTSSHEGAPGAGPDGSRAPAEEPLIPLEPEAAQRRRRWIDPRFGQRVAVAAMVLGSIALAVWAGTRDGTVDRRPISAEPVVEELEHFCIAWGDEVLRAAEAFFGVQGTGEEGVRLRETVEGAAGAMGLVGRGAGSDTWSAAAAQTLAAAAEVRELRSLRQATDQAFITMIETYVAGLRSLDAPSACRADALMAAAGRQPAG